MQRMMAVWGFLVAGLLFLLVAILPALRGGELNPTFLVLAIVFFILGGASAKRRKAAD